MNQLVGKGISKALMLSWLQLHLFYLIQAVCVRCIHNSIWPLLTQTFSLLSSYLFISSPCIALHPVLTKINFFLNNFAFVAHVYEI